MNTFFSIALLLWNPVSIPSASFAEASAEGNEVFVESGFETNCEGEDVAKCAMIKVVNNTFQGQTCEVTVEYLGGDICDGATLRRATVGGIKVGQKTSAVATKRIIPAEVPIKICGISNATIKSCKDDGLWSFSYVPNRNDYKDRVRYGERGWKVPQVLPNNPEGRRRRPEIGGVNMNNTDGGYTSSDTLRDLEAGKTYDLHHIKLTTTMQILDYDTIKHLQAENKSLKLVVEFDYQLEALLNENLYTGTILQMGRLVCTIDGKNARKYYRQDRVKRPSSGVLVYEIDGFDVEGCESGLRFVGYYWGNFFGNASGVQSYYNRIFGFRWKMKLADELESP